MVFLAGNLAHYKLEMCSTCESWRKLLPVPRRGSSEQINLTLLIVQPESEAIGTVVEGSPRNIIKERFLKRMD
jgi:hypothetical protein